MVPSELFEKMKLALGHHMIYHIQDISKQKFTLRKDSYSDEDPIPECATPYKVPVAESATP